MGWGGGGGGGGMGVKRSLSQSDPKHTTNMQNMYPMFATNLSISQSKRFVWVGS